MQTDAERINSMIQRFWEVNTSGRDALSILKAKDDLILDMAELSIV